jgi:iron complex outermembrane receptor protein
VYHGSRPVADFSGFNLSPSLPMISGYATVNLMAAYSFKLAETKITAQINVTNLLDTTYYGESANYFPPAAGYSFGFRPYGAPRTIMG